MVIRKAKAYEAATLAAIGFRAWDARLSVWTEGHDDVASIRQDARDAYLTFAFKCWDAILVAETEEGLAGWGCREDRRDVPDHRDNAISDLWIDPPFQRMGFGGEILAALEAEVLAAGQGHCVLETHARNHAAISFFRAGDYAVKWLSTRYSASLDRDIEKIGMEKVLDDEALEA